MISNQMIQKTIENIKEMTKVDCSVWDMQGRSIFSTTEETDKIKKYVSEFAQTASYNEVKRWSDGACFVIQDEGDILGVFALHGSLENMELIGKLCANQIETSYRYHKSRFGKSSFFQQLLLDNMLLVDVYNQAKKLHIDVTARRAIFVVEPKKQKDSLVLDTMKSMYASGDKDFVTSVEESQVVVIKTLDKTDGYEEVCEIANAIVDMLQAEIMVDARVAYGTIIEEIKDVSKSYKEANMALDVGRIFYRDRVVLAYNELGIGRLIHQLPMSLCEMFMEEVFHGNAMELFDKDTLMTVQAFFENNLNISETARQMYLHRNTLGYRLDKITKTTGLDVRKFDDALTFKIALMVSDHMRFLKAQE